MKNISSKTNNLTDKEISLLAGKEPHRMATLKGVNPEIYKLIKKYGTMEGYELEYNRRQYRIAEIYFEISNISALKFEDFYSKYFKKDYTTRSGFITALNQIAFTNIEKLPSSKRFNMTLKIIEKYNDYLIYVKNTIPEPIPYEKQRKEIK